MSGSAPEVSPLAAPVWVVGILGHRVLAAPGQVEAALEAELRRIAAAVATRGGELHLVSSIAAGTDLAAVRAARKIGLKLHLLLPLARDEFLKEFSNSDECAEAERTIAEAQARPECDSVRVVPGTGRRPECYFDTDVRLIEAADLLVAVWDGRPTDKLGGTGQLVSLARAMKKPVVTIDPASLALERQGFDPATWPPVDEQWRSLADAGILRGTGAAESSEARAATIKERLSRAARTDAFDFRQTAQTLILLGAIGGLIGLVSGIISARGGGYAVDILQGSQLVLSLWVLRTRSALTRRASIHKWTNARMGAELWRGLATSLPFSDPLRPIAGALLPEWRRVAVSLGLLIQSYRQPRFRREADPLAAFKADYAEKRIEDQRRYYEKELTRSSRFARWLPHVAKHCSQATPFFVAFAMINRLGGLHLASHLLGLIATVVLPAFLPMVAAAADGLVSNFDHQRRHNRYKSVAAALADFKAELEHLRTEDSVRNLVDRCERVLLSEQLEWHHLTRKAKA